MSGKRLGATMALLLALAGCRDSSIDPTAVTLRLGDSLKTKSSSRAELIWVIADKDCSSCSSPGYFWRTLRAKGDRAPAFRVMLVGADSSVVRSLLKSERVPAEIQLAHLERASDADLLPAMLLVVDDKVQRAWPARGTSPVFSSLLDGTGIGVATRSIDSALIAAKLK